jgi:hypothetical protein
VSSLGCCCCAWELLTLTLLRWGLVGSGCGLGPAARRDGDGDAANAIYSRSAAVEAVVVEGLASGLGQQHAGRTRRQRRSCVAVVSADRRRVCRR